MSEKEGNVHQVGTIDSVVHHKKVIFLDNNILAWSGHLEIFKELIRKSIKCGFNQGLDVRLVTEENAELLSQINWLGEYIFAFDYLKNEKSINRGLKILKKYILKKWQLKFYLYCHPDMDIKNDVLYRIDWCRYNQVLPYLMRDISCWGNKKQFLYTDLAAWCNQPGVFKQIEAFEDFIIKRHLGNLKRAYMILELYNKEL